MYVLFEILECLTWHLQYNGSHDFDRCSLLVFVSPRGGTGCPEKKRNRCENFLHKLFQIEKPIIIFFRSTMIRLNFDMFFRIFGDLIAEL